MIFLFLKKLDFTFDSTDTHNCKSLATVVPINQCLFLCGSLFVQFLFFISFIKNKIPHFRKKKIFKKLKSKSNFPHLEAHHTIYEFYIIIC